MRILVTNDDGIYSPGLMALAEVAADFGDIRIVAPDVEQSSMGHAITASRPLSHTRTPIPTTLEDFDAYRVNGTPADCVALGTYLWDEANVVLSGINLGTNLGNAIWHSGTLAAAKQAALLGLQGIAFSTPVDSDEPDFGPLKSYVRKVLELVLGDEDLPLVNVNLPRQPRGLRWTRQSVRHYNGKVVPATDPRGREHYWFTVTPVEETEKGTDRWAVEHNWVSMTPLRLDLTSEPQLDEAKVHHRTE